MAIDIEMELLERILKHLLVKQAVDDKFLHLFRRMVAAAKELDGLKVEGIAEALEKLNLTDHNIPRAVAAALLADDEKLVWNNLDLEMARQERSFLEVTGAFRELEN